MYEHLHGHDPAGEEAERHKAAKTPAPETPKSDPKSADDKKTAK